MWEWERTATRRLCNGYEPWKTLDAAVTHGREQRDERVRRRETIYRLSVTLTERALDLTTDSTSGRLILTTKALIEFEPTPYYYYYKIVHWVQHKLNCCCLKVLPWNPKTMSFLAYLKVIPYTKFQHYGIFRFRVMLRTNRRTRTSTHADRLCRRGYNWIWRIISLLPASSSSRRLSPSRYQADANSVILVSETCRQNADQRQTLRLASHYRNPGGRAGTWRWRQYSPQRINDWQWMRRAFVNKGSNGQLQYATHGRREQRHNELVQLTC